VPAHSTSSASFPSTGSSERAVALTARRQAPADSCGTLPRLWASPLAPNFSCLFYFIAALFSILSTCSFLQNNFRTCGYSRKARIEGRTTEAQTKRLCRRQYPFSACLPCLLRLTRLENDEFTCETGLELRAITSQHFRAMLLVSMSEN